MGDGYSLTASFDAAAPGAFVTDTAAADHSTATAAVLWGHVAGTPATAAVCWEYAATELTT